MADYVYIVAICIIAVSIFGLSKRIFMILMKKMKSIQFRIDFSNDKSKTNKEAKARKIDKYLDRY